MVVMLCRQVPGGTVAVQEAAQLLPVLRKFAEAMSETVTDTVNRR